MTPEETASEYAHREEEYNALKADIETAIKEAIAAEREACLQIVLDEIAARRTGETKTDQDAFYLMGGVAAGIKIGDKIRARSEGEPCDKNQ